MFGVLQSYGDRVLSHVEYMIFNSYISFSFWTGLHLSANVTVKYR